MISNLEFLRAGVPVASIRGVRSGTISDAELEFRSEVELDSSSLLSLVASDSREAENRGNILSKSALRDGTDAQIMAILISKPDQSEMLTP